MPISYMFWYLPSTSHFSNSNIHNITIDIIDAKSTVAYTAIRFLANGSGEPSGLICGRLRKSSQKKTLWRRYSILFNMKLPIIHIIGLPGAGKTTLARSLGKRFKIPIYGIGSYRAHFPMTGIGEADAWLALFRDLSKLKWQNCILETTGLNKRESFFRDALPIGQMMTIKLEASRRVLYQRIGKKKKKEQGGKWLFNSSYKDKYEFVRKLFKSFKDIQADYVIDAGKYSKAEVYRNVFKEIMEWPLLRNFD